MCDGTSDLVDRRLGPHLGEVYILVLSLKSEAGAVREEGDPDLGG